MPAWPSAPTRFPPGRRLVSIWIQDLHRPSSGVHRQSGTKEKSEAGCQRKCDDSIVCWGFLYDTATQACMYKGGEDSLNTRAFFIMPHMTVAATTPQSTPQSTPDESTIPPVTPSTSPSPAPSAVRKVCFSPSGPPSNTRSSVVEARYRIADNNWDLALVPRVSDKTLFHIVHTSPQVLIVPAVAGGVGVPSGAKLNSRWQCHQPHEPC
jgi:hypothetical protein